jgi:hypothetical protein
MTIDWTARTAEVLALYREGLLRAVAAKLVRPRSQYDVEVLRDRMMSALEDPVGLDRTLKPVSPAARQLLRLIDISCQPRWSVQTFADILPLLGHTDGLAPVIELLECGLIFPDLVSGLPVESFSAWIEQATFDALAVFTVPFVAARCRAEPFDLALPAGEKTKHTPVEADGLEWLLRSTIVWQLVRGGPLRRTQTGGLFKRDQERLRGHSVLATAPADALIELPDPSLLAVELARGIGVVIAKGDEWLAGDLPASWGEGLGAALAQLWTSLNSSASWSPDRGYDPEVLGRKWRPALGMALAVALIDAPPTQWYDPVALATWIATRQPDAAREVPDLAGWCSTWLLGVLHPLRIVESAKTADGWRVRLSVTGRAILSGAIPETPAPPITQTLLVQPNLEVIVYRQGLTPSLLSTLSRFAEWKTVGLAGTLTLTPESVYRGLESGLSLIEVQRTLERHATRPLSESVIETLRSWASKRERVQVYPQAVLLEFRTSADLDTALRQGTVEQKLTDRIGIVSSEKSIDYSLIRLAGSRDYMSPEEICVDVGPDGLSLFIADGKADLLLESEARRFADVSMDNRATLQLSPASLRRAKESGVDLRWLEDWFHRRAGMSVPPTAKMLFQAGGVGPLSVAPQTVLRVPSVEVGDGLERWPAAQAMIVERLGPMAFVVRVEALPALTQLLAEAGITLQPPAP